MPGGDERGRGAGDREPQAARCAGAPWTEVDSQDRQSLCGLGALTGANVQGRVGDNESAVELAGDVCRGCSRQDGPHGVTGPRRATPAGVRGMRWEQS